MALGFNVGFAQVTVKPVFTGFQTAVKRQVGTAMPGAGQQAGKTMATGFNKGATDTLAKGAKATSQTATKALPTEDVARKRGTRIGGAFVGSLKSALAPMAGLFAVAGIGRFVGSAISAASDLEESYNAVNVTFGENAEGIKRLGREAAESVGMSNEEFNGLAVRFSAFTEQIAGDGGDVVGTMEELTGRASDFASVMNLDVAEAAQLFQSGLAGESEPLRKFGIDLSAAAVEAYALENGIAASAGEMTEAEKVQARYGLIMEQTQKTQGDFANTSGDLANAQRILKSNWADMKAQIGQALIPAMAGLVTKVKDDVLPAIQNLFDWVKDNKEQVKQIAIALGAATVAVGAFAVGLKITGAIKAMSTAIRTAGGAMAFLNTTMLANPLVWVGVLIAALVVAVVLAWQRFETFRNVVKAAWEGIQSAASFAWNKVIKPVFNAIWGFIRDTLIPLFIGFYKNVIKPVWERIQFAIKAAWNVIKFVFDLIKWYINNVLAPIFRFLYDKVIKPIWDAISDKISTIWNDNIKPVLKALGNFIEDTVAPAFQRGVDRIRDIWNSLKRIAAVPINFVIEDVYNNGIKAVFDKVADAIGSDARLPRASKVSWGSDSAGRSGGGRAVQARAKGGWTPPGMTLVGEEGPELIDVRTPGRVYTAEETRQMLSGEPPHGSVWDSLGNAWANTWRGARDAALGGLDWVRGGLATLAERVLGPLVDGLTSALPGNGLPGIVRGATRNSVDMLVDWIRGKDEEGAGPWVEGTPTGPRMRGAKPWVAWAGNKIANAVGAPGMRMDAFNNSMAGGHPRGLALDFIAGRGILDKVANYMAKNAAMLGIDYIAWQKQLFKPGGGWGVQRVGYGNDPWHRWHVHGEFHNRSVVPNGSAALYDDGGWLMPNTLAASKLSQPEPVLTPSQWDTMYTLARRGSDTQGQYVANITVPSTNATPEDIASTFLFDARKYDRGGRYRR